MISPRRCLAYVLVPILVIVLGITFLLPKGHQHCIKAAISLLVTYSDENYGEFPTSERGWADALLEFEKSNPNGSWIAHFTNIDDKGEYFRLALVSGSDIDESLPSRIYVQGLNSKSSGQIAILFDRKSTSGGDHGRSLFNTRPMLREVIRVNGVMETVRDPDWPAFVQRQRELLKHEGFTDTQINEAYGEF